MGADSFREFSPNRPTGSIWSSSYNVRPYVCCILSPSHAILPGEQMRSQGSKAVSHRGICTLKKVTHNYWLSEYMIRSRLPSWHQYPEKNVILYYWPSEYMIRSRLPFWHQYPEKMLHLTIDNQIT